MKQQHKPILTKGQTIDDKYKVTFFLKKGSYAESYRVTDEQGDTKLFKLFSYAKLHRTQFDQNGDVLEIKILKQLDHANLVKFYDDGELLIHHQKYAYAILDFISGETLADKMKREHVLNPYETKDIILGVLNGLKYLHQLEEPIIHNEITNLNVMLDLSHEVPVPKIIDFGYARFLKQPNKAFLKEGLNPFYQANEAFNKVFSPQNDVFSAGALYYHLLFGMPPWFVELSAFKADRSQLEDLVIRERTKPLKFPESDSRIDPITINIISKALHPDVEERFRNTQDFIHALNGELEVQLSTPAQTKSTTRPKVKKAGEGFSAIAGMQGLKDTIQLDVIDALNDKERYEEYGLTIPNGMLLYGPPGCGKTFFAEKMAEELEFNFYQIKPSDIQSKWVNASQENIKKLFDDARESAPSIIFIDELDAVVPSRDNASVNHMNTSAVNEFLAQMNNCGEDGIFIIGATNMPDSIDSAILRAGRLDKKIYVPVPDKEARASLFELYLNKRPVELGLDYNILADKTENYASVDIKHICDEASRQALRLHQRITSDILSKTIQVTRPSSSLQALNNYRAIRSKMEGETENNHQRPTIGFKRN